MRPAYRQTVARITTVLPPKPLYAPWMGKRMAKQAQQRAFWILTVGRFAGGAALSWLLTRRCSPGRVCRDAV